MMSINGTFSVTASISCYFLLAVVSFFSPLLLLMLFAGKSVCSFGFRNPFVPKNTYTAMTQNTHFRTMHGPVARLRNCLSLYRFLSNQLTVIYHSWELVFVRSQMVEWIFSPFLVLLLLCQWAAGRGKRIRLYERKENIKCGNKMLLMTKTVFFWWQEKWACDKKKTMPFISYLIFPIFSSLWCIGFAPTLSYYENDGIMYIYVIANECQTYASVSVIYLK